MIYLVHQFYLWTNHTCFIYATFTLLRTLEIVTFLMIAVGEDFNICHSKQKSARGWNLAARGQREKDALCICLTLIICNFIGRRTFWHDVFSFPGLINQSEKKTKGVDRQQNLSARYWRDRIHHLVVMEVPRVDVSVFIWVLVRINNKDRYSCRHFLQTTWSGTAARPYAIRIDGFVQVYPSDNQRTNVDLMLIQCWFNNKSTLVQCILFC